MGAFCPSFGVILILLPVLVDCTNHVSKAWVKVLTGHPYLFLTIDPLVVSLFEQHFVLPHEVRKPIHVGLKSLSLF